MFEIVPYRPSWAAEFQALEQELHPAVAPFVSRLDHIGSTAVPGLAAKDVLDVQLTVVDFSCTEVLSQGLRPLGYELRPSITHDHLPPGESDPGRWEKRYFRETGNKRRTHIHVRRAGAPNWRYALLFRDYLRAHPLAAAAYGEFKYRLMALHGQDETLENYVHLKDPVFDLILYAAEAWAREVGWMSSNQ